MEDGLSRLRQVVEEFPVSNLYLTVIHHPRSGTYHVKTSLALSGKTLFTGDRDVAVYPAYERCVRKLVRKAAAYKQQMRRDPEHTNQRGGTDRPVASLGEVDTDRLAAAVQVGDYTEFYVALDTFIGPLQDRVGRWIERYPTIRSHLDSDFTVSDIVEEVLLTAFERFHERPREVPAGDWLESLVDPAVHALIESPDEELDNIRFVQTMRDG